MNNGTPQSSSSSRQLSHASQRLPAHIVQVPRPRTPVMSDEPSSGSRDVTVEEDPRVIAFRTRYKETEARLSRLFLTNKSSGDGTTLDDIGIDAIPLATEIAKPPELTKV